MAPTPSKSVLALDVGDKRVGIAIASLAALLPRPLITLERDDTFTKKLQAIIQDEVVGSLVLGLPRNLSGRRTDQTTAVESFANELRQVLDLPISFQDEAVTSKQAEAELESRRKPYKRGDIDALAATYILEDYLASKSNQEEL